jgi:hypothetical protein
VPHEDQTNLTGTERAMLKRISERDGVSEDEAATLLVKAALERRVRKRTGKGPARVFEMNGRTGTPRR